MCKGRWWLHKSPLRWWMSPIQPTRRFLFFFNAFWIDYTRESKVFYLFFFFSSHFDSISFLSSTSLLCHHHAVSSFHGNGNDGEQGRLAVSQYERWPEMMAPTCNVVMAGCFLSAVSEQKDLYLSDDTQWTVVDLADFSVQSQTGRIPPYCCLRPSIQSPHPPNPLLTGAIHRHASVQSHLREPSNASLLCPTNSGCCVRGCIYVYSITRSASTLITKHSPFWFILSPVTVVFLFFFFFQPVPDL